jgi:hypothetical protein
MMIEQVEGRCFYEVSSTASFTDMDLFTKALFFVEKISSPFQQRDLQKEDLPLEQSILPCHPPLIRIL